MAQLRANRLGRRLDGGLNAPDQCGDLCIGWNRLADQPVLQDLILDTEQTLEGLPALAVELGVAMVKEVVEQQVELEHAAPTLPAQALDLARVEIIHTDCSSIRSLIWPIALVGFKPLGQTSTQFMMLWQRNSLYGPSSASRRSSVA